MHKTAPEDLLIGAHVSASGGVHHALLNGHAIGATTIQLFTSNQRQWNGKPIDPKELELWYAALEKVGLKKIMSHDSYLINLGSPSKELLDKSIKTFKEELTRCHELRVTYLNFHPGAATDGNVEACLDRIVESVLELQPLCDKGPTRLLLEATAGQGNSIGHRFEHLGYLVERLHKKIPIGVCIDTCHIFAAGYDIRTESGWDKTLEEFDTKVGLNHLYAFHLNDSMKPLGSRRDRHAPLGEGEIGKVSFQYLMTHPKLRELPKYMETPVGPEGWKEEIKMLRNFAKHTS